MFKSSRFALILGLAGAMAGLPSLTAQNDSDAAGVAAAMRFQKAEDAAAARQARIEAGRKGEANSADRMATQMNAKGAPSTAQNQSKAADVEAAVRFQRAEDAAAARQARIEVSEGETNSADRMAAEPTVQTKTPHTSSATARKMAQPQRNPQ